jgi:hypothetical protein
MRLQMKVGIHASQHMLVSMLFILVLTVACGNDNRSGNQSTGQSSTPDIKAGQSTPANSTTPSRNLAVEMDAAATPCVQPESRTGANREQEPCIQITILPHKGKGGEQEVETIGGKVGGVKVEECRVVIFAHTNTWYVQPYQETPHTTINADNTWTSDTHLGREYAALLVRATYKPPSITGTLPNVGGGVLAITTVTGKEAGK